MSYNSLMQSKPECSVDGCTRPQRAKRLCDSCYNRSLRNGGVAQPLPNRHNLSNVNLETRRGDCRICGIGVPVRIRSSGGNECGRKDRQGSARRAKKRDQKGMAWADYSAMRIEQGDRCAICRADVERLCADHCHKTGKVRGLLCRKCNFALGYLRDDPAIARAAAEYLDRSLL